MSCVQDFKKSRNFVNNRPFNKLRFAYPAIDAKEEQL